MSRKLLANRKLLEMASKGQKKEQFMAGYLCIFEIRERLAHLLQ